jgi:hypothetical protein
MPSDGAGTTCRPRRASPSTSAVPSGKLREARNYDDVEGPVE